MKLFAPVTPHDDLDWAEIAAQLLAEAAEAERLIVNRPETVQLAADAVFPPFLLPTPGHDRDVVIEFEFEREPDATAVLELLDRNGEKNGYVVRSAYLSQENDVKTPKRTWPDGQASPGLKLLLFGARLPHLNHEEFAAYWRDVHAPIVVEHHPGIWRYIQNVVGATLRGVDDEFDGIDELGFETDRDLTHRFTGTEESRLISEADAKKFVIPVRNYLFRELVFTRA